MTDRRGRHGRSRGRRRCRSGRRRRLDRAIAIFSGGGRRPVGVTPAEFAGAVLPHQAIRVAPVVDRLLGKRARHRRGKRSRCEEHRHLVQFLHDSPLKESRSCLRYVQIGSKITWQTPGCRERLPPTTHCAIGCRMARILGRCSRRGVHHVAAPPQARPLRIPLFAQTSAHLVRRLALFGLARPA